MSLKPKSASALWFAVPLLAMNMIACGDDEEVPTPPQPPGSLCGNDELDDGEECDDGNKNNTDACTNECVDAICGDGIRQTAPSGEREDCDDGNGIDGDGCNNMCKGPSCGNGVKEIGEACDGGDGCTDECTLESCGDGVVQEPEECDDGNQSDRDGCTTKCLDPACGDGVVQSGEDCDEGSQNSNFGDCLKTCKEPSCGDGFVHAGVELCDDKNTDDDDDCTNECTPKSCGDGITQAPEECDDGNQDDSDGCTSRCTSGSCGDGIVQGAEECDDGNKDQSDGCLNTCEAASCGDGVIQRGLEACDDGEDNGPAPAKCTDQCNLVSCGDGKLDPGEECDLGTAPTVPGGLNGDDSACLLTCQLNVCGDGKALTDEDTLDLVDTDSELEECDDANDDNSDACVDSCLWNTCGDGEKYTKMYSPTYTSDDDGNEHDDNPYAEIGPEACDDGNTSNSDGCVTSRHEFTGGIVGLACALNVCGDGNVYSNKSADDGNPYPKEDCDDADDPGDVTRNNDSCLDSCVWNSCHDGFLYDEDNVTDPNNPNEPEECDDGNESNTDACVGECALPSCGDNFVWRGHEQCDDGNASNTPCNTSCVLTNSTCGNGTRENSEECDDGNGNDNDSCLSTCQFNSCGDGIRYLAVTLSANNNPIEACDDGDGFDGNDCLSTCTWNKCGDGNALIRRDLNGCDPGYSGEICDIDLDRDNAGGDDDVDAETAGYCDDLGANPMDECQNPFYQGNGTLEDCDDGNTNNNDSCLTATCAFNGCGDEFLYTTPTDPRNKNLLEVCDEGTADSTTCLGTTPFGAIPAEQWEFLQCTPSACGDGVVNPAAGETCDPGDDEDCPSTCIVATCGDGNDGNDGAYAECDDGNDVNTDGCTNNCMDPRCGDGIIQQSEGEECDDGNDDPTDACTDVCLEATCGDGVRQQGVEGCDFGTPAGADDGYDDDQGFCNADCEVECFTSEPRAWAKSYEDTTCIFVPEPPGADDDSTTEYNDGGYLYMDHRSADAYCDGLGINARLVKIQAGSTADTAAKNQVVTNIVAATVTAAGSDQYCPSTGADVVSCFIDNDGGDPELCNPLDPLDVGYDPLLDDTEECPRIPDDDGGDEDMCCIGGSPLGMPYWIGLSDEHTNQTDPPGYWTWLSDGTLVSGGSNGGANPLWDGPNNEPNDLDGDTTTPGQEDCGVIIARSTDGATAGRWHDRSCGEQARFVCEFPLEQNP